MLRRLEPVAYALLRVIAGLMFAMHGAQKLLGWPPGMNGPLPPLLKVAGLIELVGGLLVALGLFTTLAAILASGEMAVAYFKAHAPMGFWPIENKGELAVLYCFVFLSIAAYGAGRWGLDARRSARAR